MCIVTIKSVSLDSYMVKNINRTKNHWKGKNVHLINKQEALMSYFRKPVPVLACLFRERLFTYGFHGSKFIWVHSNTYTRKKWLHRIFIFVKFYNWIFFSTIYKRFGINWQPWNLVFFFSDKTHQVLSRMDQF